MSILWALRPAPLKSNLVRSRVEVEDRGLGDPQLDVDIAAYRIRVGTDPMRRRDYAFGRRAVQTCQINAESDLQM